MTEPDDGVIDACEVCGEEDVPLERVLTAMDGFIWLCEDCRG